jgi:hypothetical protein
VRRRLSRRCRRRRCVSARPPEAKIEAAGGPFRLEVPDAKRAALGLTPRQRRDVAHATTTDHGTTDAAADEAALPAEATPSRRRP